MEAGKLPQKGTPNSARYDVFSYKHRIITPGSNGLVSLGFKCAIPKGYYGQLKSRSGLALRKQLTVDAGVIDSDYRGIVSILLANNSGTEFFICEKGMRVGQMIILKCEDCHFKAVKN